MLRNTKDSYGWIAIGLHWAVAALFLVQFTLGLTMVRLSDQRRAFDLIQLHKSIGLLILVLAVLRLSWWAVNRRPALPTGTTPIERAAARLVHGLLYVLQFALPLSGWALVSVSVLAIPTMPFDLFVMPNLPLAPDEHAENVWSSTHEAIAWIAIGLVALHAAAALYHHLWRRDDILKHMLGSTRREFGADRRR